MASFSNYTENAVLNMLLNKVPFDVASSYDVYVGLFKSDTGLEDNNPAVQNEVQDSASYRRLRAADFGGYTTATAGTSHNAGDMEFQTATTNWGNITHTALLDGGTVGAGNVIMWAPLANPREVFAGDVIRIREGAHVITIS